MRSECRTYASFFRRCVRETAQFNESIGSELFICSCALAATSPQCKSFESMSDQFVFPVGAPLTQIRRIWRVTQPLRATSKLCSTRDDAAGRITSLSVTFTRVLYDTIARKNSRPPQIEWKAGKSCKIHLHPKTASGVSIHASLPLHPPPHTNPFSPPLHLHTSLFFDVVACVSSKSST